MTAARALPRQQRLRRHNDFLRVERSGMRADGRFVTLVATATRGAAPGRVGFTVSRKVSLKATERNLVKRRLREVVRAHKEWLAGRDLIVIARPTAVGQPLRDLDADLCAAASALLQKQTTQRPPSAAGKGRNHGEKTRH